MELLIVGKPNVGKTLLMINFAAYLGLRELHLEVSEGDGVRRSQRLTTDRARRDLVSLYAPRRHNDGVLIARHVPRLRFGRGINRRPSLNALAKFNHAFRASQLQGHDNVIAIPIARTRVRGNAQGLCPVTGIYPAHQGLAHHLRRQKETLRHETQIGSRSADFTPDAGREQLVGYSVH